jgi:hypothetical protein
VLSAECIEFIKRAHVRKGIFRRVRPLRPLDNLSKGIIKLEIKFNNTLENKLRKVENY